MVRRLVTMVATLAVGALAAAAWGQAAPPAPPAGGAATALPPGPGHDEMVRVCSGCHAPEIAAQQRLSPAGWHELVGTMIGNGAQGSDADFAAIEAYLAKNFPEQPAK